MLRLILIGLLGAVGGILGNLVAAIIEPSLGSLTPLQLIGMILGILAVIVMVSAVEAKPRPGSGPDKDLQDLQRRVALERTSLYQLRAKAQSGVPVEPETIDIWLSHQAQIRAIKQQITDRGGALVSDPIDEAPPPNLGCLVRATMALKLALGSLFVVPFVVALMVSWVMAPVAQRFIIDNRPPMPIPVLVETQTPTEFETAIPISTSTMEPTPIVEPTRSTLEPTQVPTEPLPEAAINDFVPPTPTPVAASGTLLPPTPTITVPPFASTLIAPALPGTSPTINPEVRLTQVDTRCEDPFSNARITNVALQAAPNGTGLVNVYGVANRLDFTEYRIYWALARLSGQSVESGQVFVFTNPVSQESVLQARPLEELEPPDTYRVTLRVFGSGDAQYQECQVLVEVPRLN